MGVEGMPFSQTPNPNPETLNLVVVFNAWSLVWGVSGAIPPEMGSDEGLV